MGTADADSARERIVVAAKGEFAAHGIAGARVERIAKDARTSKERLYAYFRSKEELYAHVMSRELAVIAEATHLDAADLPGYAGRLFDYFTANTDHFRLIAWGRLEFEVPRTLAKDDPTEKVVRRKLDQIREAQRGGYIDPTWEPVDVLALVTQIATTWCSQGHLRSIAAPKARRADVAAHRAAVVEAVQRIFPARADRPRSK